MKVNDEDISRHQRQSRYAVGNRSRSSIWIIIITALVIGVIFAYINRAAIIAQLQLGTLGDIKPSAEETQDTKPSNRQILEIENLNLAVSSMLENIAKLQEQIKFLNGANQRDNVQFKKIDRQLKDINTKIQVIAGQLESIDTNLQGGIARQNEQDNIIKENISNLQKNIATLDSLYRNQAQNLADIESGLTNINARVTELER